MKRWARSLGFVLLILTILNGTWRAAAAQGGIGVKLAHLDPGQLPTMTARVSVVDENGLPILDLKADSFELTEDGRTSVRPATVKAVANDDVALSVLILIDLSATMQGEPLKAAKDATARFLDELLNAAADADRAAFIGFGASVDIKALTVADNAREVPFTNDKGRLLNVVNFVEIDAGAGTPLYDALYRAVKIMAGQPGRRAILVMTDGADVGSILKDNDPIDEARRQHIPVFPVGLSNSRLDVTYLKRLAELTGGQYQEAPKPSDLAQSFQTVLSELKIEYVLTYQSQWSRLDAQTHSVLVRVQTVRGQGFDEMKVQLANPTATLAALGLTASPQASGTSVPLPTITPTTEVGMLDNLRTWVSDNTLLAAGIGAAAFLFLMLIVLAVVLMRRRSAAAASERAASAVPPAWSPPDAGAAPASYVADARTGAGMTAGTTLSADAAPPGTGSTWVAPIEQPIARQPFGFQPAAPPRQEQAEAEGTVVLQRGPRPKVLGLLVDRRQPERRYDLNKTSVTVGRSVGNSIVIEDPTISRQHAAIKLEAGEFRLYDLGSANGTFVADARVRDPVVLPDGAIVRFGEAEFIFKRVSLE